MACGCAGGWWAVGVAAPCLRGERTAPTRGANSAERETRALACRAIHLYLLYIKKKRETERARARQRWYDAGRRGGEGL